jgi:hypothetical protein
LFFFFVSTSARVGSPRSNKSDEGGEDRKIDPVAGIVEKLDWPLE